MIKTAATARNIRLIVETIITSHTGMAYLVEHKAQSTSPHHCLSLLINIECACEEHNTVARAYPVVGLTKRSYHG